MKPGITSACVSALLMLALPCAALAASEAEEGEIAAAEQQLGMACQSPEHGSDTAIQIGQTLSDQFKGKIAALNTRASQLQDYLRDPVGALRDYRVAELRVRLAASQAKLDQATYRFEMASGGHGRAPASLRQVELNQVSQSHHALVENLRQLQTNPEPVLGAEARLRATGALGELRSINDLSLRYRKIEGKARHCATMALMQAHRNAEDLPVRAVDAVARLQSGDPSALTSSFAVEGTGGKGAVEPTILHPKDPNPAVDPMVAIRGAQGLNGIGQGGSAR